MLTERRHPLTVRIASTVATCLALAALFVTGCERSSDSTAAAPTTPAPEEAKIVSVLTADPNPIPAGSAEGKTMITWVTGSPADGDVFMGPIGGEKLLATGPKGNQEASGIKPGSIEFRLYTHADHKLLAELTVTMAPSDVPASSPTTAPVSSASP